MYRDANLTTLHNKVVTEANITRFIGALQSRVNIVSQDCRENAIPFICQFAYPPCINDTTYQLITKEQCQYLKDDVCATEWLIATAILPGLLPDCDLLDEKDGFLSIDQQKSTNNESVCSEQFDEYCNELCVPSCERFSQYDESTTLYRKVIDVIAAVISLVGGTVFIIIAVIRRKNL